ncbi:hypothetical protein WDU94_003589 [Cyamophila willieti]
MGPDGIHPFFLKTCYSTLSHPLFLLFNQSLSTGTFPCIWKHSFIKPIPKKDLSKTNISNYRPISILSAVPKLFESLVLDKFLPFVSRVIIDNQHGFVPGKSVTSNLLVYSNFLYSEFSHHHQIDSLYLDLTKAFDRVNHRILIDKLESNGVTGTLLRWFSSYLSNRTSSVHLGSFVSDPFHVTSGVPQGSHLGPILFLVFINDVHLILSNFDVQYLLFCDDFKVFKSIQSNEDFLVLQNALSSLCSWFETNCLTVNPSKCNIISFSRSEIRSFSYHINSSVIPRVSCVRDLGVFFDFKLSFVPHINLIRNKASRMLGYLIRSSRDFTTVLPIKILYCSLVRGVLEFASPVWNPYYGIHNTSLERIQHRALHFMSKKMQISQFSYFAVESSLSLLPLSSRRTLYDLVTFYKILHSQVNTPQLLNGIKS